MFSEIDEVKIETMIYNDEQPMLTDDEHSELQSNEQFKLQNNVFQQEVLNGMEIFFIIHLNKLLFVSIFLFIFYFLKFSKIYVRQIFTFLCHYIWFFFII